MGVEKKSDAVRLFVSLLEGETWLNIRSHVGMRFFKILFQVFKRLHNYRK